MSFEDTDILGGMTSVGQRLVDLLGATGSPIFGVPGGQTLPLYAASAASGHRHVLVRDERNAACAADAYARVTGQVGICDATVGPGVTNLVSGLAEAYASSIPVIAIIADIRRDTEHLRRRSVVSQALDQRALLAPVTKWVGQVREPAALDEIVDHALRVATTGRCGPVAIEIPEDIFLGAADLARPRTTTPSDLEYPRHRPGLSTRVLEEVAALVRGASRPVVLAGGGVVLSGAAAALTQLAESHNLPVVTTLNGKGGIDERARLSGGVVGSFGTARGNVVVRSANLVIAVGTKLDQLTTHSWRLPALSQDVVHIDIDGEEIGRTMPVRIGDVADARSFLEQLDTALVGWSSPGVAGGSWIDDINPHDQAKSPGDGRISPVEVVSALDDLLGPDDLLVCDASLASGWAATYFRIKRSGVGMVAPRGLAGLGWAPGAALGARLGRPAGKVVVLTGDGAWGYGLVEVETAARLGLDISYVVLNNAALGWVRHAEEAMYPESSSTFDEVDFAGVARGMGANAWCVHDPTTLATALADALRDPGPSLVDVKTSVDPSPVIRLGVVRQSPYI